MKVFSYTLIHSIFYPASHLSNQASLDWRERMCVCVVCYTVKLGYMTSVGLWIVQKSTSFKENLASQVSIPAEFVTVTFVKIPSRKA